jgi:hypothetical protein
MKQISNIIYGIAAAVLLAGALTPASREKDARAGAAVTTDGLMPVVVVTAPGPNQIVNEIIVRPTPRDLAETTATPTTVN